MTLQRKGGVSRRSLLSVGLLGGAAAALSACGSPLQRGIAPGAGAPLRIGANLELSGSSRIAGVAAHNALVIIAQTIADAGGFVVGGQSRQVELVVLDNQSDPDAAATMTRTLIGKHDVAAIVGGASATTSMAMAPIAEKFQTAMVSLSSASAIAAPIQNRAYVFKLGPDAADVAQMLVGAVKARHHRNVALMAADDAHGDDGVEAMKTQLSLSGVHGAGTVRLPAGASPGDYQKQVKTALGWRPDAVIVWAQAPTSALAARALRAAGYHGEVFFDAGAASADTLAPTNRAAVDRSAYVVSPRVLSGTPFAINTPAAIARQDFFVRYTQADAVFDGLAAYGADALKLIVAAAKSTQSFDRAVLRDSLENTIYEGVAGAYTFSTLNHGGVQPDSLALFEVMPSGWVQLN